MMGSCLNRDWEDKRLRALCHSEISEESPVVGFRFFTPLRSVQNDMGRRGRLETCPY